MGELASAAIYAERAVAAAAARGPMGADQCRAARGLLVEVLVAAGQWSRAAAAADTMIAQQPQDPTPWRNWAWLLQSGGRFVAAGNVARRARAASPGESDFVYKEALALASLGRAREAGQSLDSALGAFPGNIELLRARAFFLNACDRASGEELLAAHKALGSAVRAAHGSTALPPKPAGAVRDRPVVALMSSDLRRHSVAYFISPLLRHHEATGLDLRVFSTSPRSDEVTGELRRAIGAERWRDLGGAAPERIAEAIVREGVDLLIDLHGLSAGASLEVLARRPAPLQATYLGYPNTTGLECVDFRIVDAISDPPGAADALCVERLARVEGCAWCFDPSLGGEPPAVEAERDAVDARGAGASSGGGGLMFGSFNALSKISDRTLRLWAGVLGAVPGSGLILKAHGLDEPEARADLAKRAEACGMNPDALRMQGRVEPRAEHLRAYRHIEIALDTFPYHGTTTTCEALLMGVPVVTLAGSEHRSRVGVSLLTASGLTELIARDEQEFVAIAAALAGDLNRRTEMHRTLRTRLKSSRLCDGPACARAFGACVRTMVHERARA